MKYNHLDFSWGSELEWGDIPKTMELPSNLGAFEFAESCVVNVNPGPDQYLACDPSMVMTTLGGEINTMPTWDWRDQVRITKELIYLFNDQGYRPSATPGISDQGIHVHVPGLENDLPMLKRLLTYCQNNWMDMFKLTYNPPSPHQWANRWIKQTINYSSEWRSKLPDQHYKLAMAQTDLVGFHRWMGYDSVNDKIERGSVWTPNLRWGFNFDNFVRTKTFEFRFFNSTIDLHQVADTFRFCEQFMINALAEDGKSVAEIVDEGKYHFAPFMINPPAYKGWWETHHATATAGKHRKFWLPGENIQGD